MDDIGIQDVGGDKYSQIISDNAERSDSESSSVASPFRPRVNSRKQRILSDDESTCSNQNDSNIGTVAASISINNHEQKLVNLNEDGINAKKVGSADEANNDTGCDSESSRDESHEDNIKKSQNIDSDEEASNAALQFPSSVCNNSSDEKSNNDMGKVKTKRKKKLIKLDNKLQIASETQRLEREKSLHLPYHRPKQRSLREFLSRKKTHILTKDSLRSTSEKMICVWEEIADSTRKVADFFKSDSEEEAIDNNYMKDVSIDAHLSSSDNNASLANAAVENEDPLSNPAEWQSKSNNVVHQNDVMTKVIECEQVERDRSQSNGVITEEFVVDTCVGNLSEDVTMSIEKTSNWLNSVIAFEKKEKLIAKLGISPNILEKVPTLSIDDDDFVDFDVPKTLELKNGAKQLMDRLLKCRQQKAPAPIKFTSTSAQHDSLGELKNITTELITLKPPLDDNLSKPGLKYQELKAKLRCEIENKWEEQFSKKTSTTEVENKDDFEEAVEDELLEADSESSAETESEPPEEDVCVRDRPRKFCEFADSEAEESDNDADDEALEDEDEEDRNEECIEANHRKADDDKLEKLFTNADEMDCSLLPAFQPGGGLLQGGSTLTQLTQPLPIMQFSPLSSPAVSMTPKTPRGLLPETAVITPRATPAGSYQLLTNGPKKNLFGADDSLSGVQTQNEGINDIDDPFMFVSGAFPDDDIEPSAEPLLKMGTNTKRIIMGDISDNSLSVPGLDETEPEPHTDATTSAAKQLESDDGADDDIDISRRKKRKMLTFSDDEDEDSVAEDANDIDEVVSEEDSENKECPNEVDYDSEENEVKPVKTTDFFDREAELSESEWSGDEDERGLDRLEVEAGDADVLDERQVASQLERIHMRRLLDDDARDVRLLQEMLFEDGDLHGDGKTRDRKFRWKNLSGFDLFQRKECQQGSDGEEDEDANLAKIRHERRQFFRELEKEDNLEDVQEQILKNNKVFKLGSSLLEAIKARPLSSYAKSMNTRSSFLNKDSGFLSRVTKVTGVVGEGPLGPAHSRNFVFAAQDKEEILEAGHVTEESGKRKATEDQAIVKRSKLVVVRDKPSLLDQLE